jgi:hypothetical protein
VVFVVWFLKCIKTSKLMMIKEIAFGKKEYLKRTTELNEVEVIERLKYNSIIQLYVS